MGASVGVYSIIDQLRDYREYLDTRLGDTLEKIHKYETSKITPWRLIAVWLDRIHVNDLRERRQTLDEQIAALSQVSGET